MGGEFCDISSRNVIWMKMNRLVILFVALLSCVMADAKVKGVVLDDKGYPLVGANVHWAGTTVGMATDLDGKFEVDEVKSTRLLVSSFMGYHNDTTEVRSHSELTIVLVSDLELDEVSIVERKMAVLRSRI
jgi:hypothetical protein